MATVNLAAFGRYLRQRMLMDCMTCSELLRKIHCDKSYITLLRQGKREPSVGTLLDLERAITGFSASVAVIYMGGAEAAS